jgi:hypothetical protein
MAGVLASGIGTVSSNDLGKRVSIIGRISPERTCPMDIGQAFSIAFPVPDKRHFLYAAVSNIDGPSRTVARYRVVHTQVVQ